MATTDRFNSGLARLAESAITSLVPRSYGFCGRFLKKKTEVLPLERIPG